MLDDLIFVPTLVALLFVSCAPAQPAPAPDNGGLDRPRDQGIDRSADGADALDVLDGGDTTADSGDTAADADDVAPADTESEDVPYFRNARVGFQYVGSDGASHFVDDVRIVDASENVVVDEGFENNELPESWLVQSRVAFYTWEMHFGLNEAHTGTYSAKVTWYQNQDEWLITPALDGDGPFTVTFWNKGAVELVDAATLHVHYTCTDGYEWTELYTFPGAGEDGSYIWYSNTVVFDCP